MPLNIHLQRLVDRLRLDSAAAPYAAWVRLQWRRGGRPSPAPASVKRQIIRAHAERHSLSVLVESGTFLGGTVRAMLPYFREIVSIELSDALYDRAVRRFDGCDSVVLLKGDSAVQLPAVLRRLQAPALFWLDGHYSAGFTAKAQKETPVVEELDAVLSSDLSHVILIDDARLFDGTHDYPTLDALKARVMQVRPEYSVTVADDIIRVVPSSSA